MKFSVVIPSLNSRLIDQTLDSLDRQHIRRADYEVIVVGMDQLSLIQERPGFRFDRTEGPLSPAQARNRGAAQSTNEILVFTDADCIAQPDWLEEFAARFSDPQVSIVGGGIEFEQSNYWTLADNLSMFYDYQVGLPATVKQQLPSLNLALRKRVFEQIGGFDERYPRAAGEDADLTVRLRQVGYTLYFEPRARVKHCPPRNRLIDLWRHGYFQGKYSVKVDPRYTSTEGLVWPFRTRFGLVVGSPILAVAATRRIFRKPLNRGRWYTAPAILMAKFAWCFGAAAHP